MAATKDRTLSVMAVQIAEQNAYPMAAAAKIYADCFVGMVAADGNARALVAGDKCLGLATQHTDNTNGAANDVKIRVTTGGLVKMPVVGAVASSVGAQVYASDDQTAQLSSANSASKVGFVRMFVGDLGGTGCWVKISAPEANA
jgi:hypothetical protein